MASQQNSLPLGSQQQQPFSVFDTSRTPPLSFTPSLSALNLHTPVSPNALSQSPHVNTPTTNQLSPSLISPKGSLSSRDSMFTQNLLARSQNQLPFSLPSTRTSPLLQDAFSSLSSSHSLPTLDSSSTLSAVSPTIPTPPSLSPAASQFQIKPKLLDAPIHIHSLPFINTTGNSDGNVRATDGGISGSDVLSLTAALLNEGPTPTQESFKPLQIPAYPESIRTVSAVSNSPSKAAPFAPPTPTTHIIEIDDSPIPPSEPSPLLSSHASPSLISSYQNRGAMGPSPSPSVSATDSQCGQSAASDDFKTPNVYINGLPPNFPEDQLLAMTREFGEVVSVRTFTRHVSDRPSGYGFVLFGSVDAAEKCIETLRKYRNLHPSYSKRVHKIPGTMYASALPPSPADPAPGVSPSASESDTFKSRMERLQDTGSTNLYMEGLPMDINEPTLTALVSPYKIMSSRFFQTRLSVPARVIAFVRLESRTAAEEIIERLHGRMVRGWADAGCRISVRFADTSEQRELRRMERMNRDGDQSPSRLTVAQAALLNLKGGQLHTSPGMGNSSLPGLSPSFAVSPLPSVSGHSPSFHPVGLRGPGMVSPASSIPSPLEYEQLFAHGNVPLVPGDSFRSQHHLASRKMTPSPLPLQHHLDQHQRMQQFTQNSLPAIGHAGTNPAYVAHDHMLNSRAAELGPTLRIPPHLGSYDETSVLADPVGSRLMEESSAATRSQNGFTSLERDILQQYLQSQQLQQHILRQEQTGITRNVGPDGSLSAAGKANSVLLGRRLMNTLPSLSEEDFHAQAASGRSGGPPLATNSGVSVHLSPVTQTQPPSIPPSRLAMDDVNAKLNFTRQRNQTHTSGSKLLPRLDDGCNDGPDREGSEERTRCSTMPEDYSGRRSSDAFQGFSTATGAEVPKSSITNNSTNGVEHNSSTSQNDHRIKHHLDSTVRDTSPNHRAAHADTTCDVMADSINLKPSNTRIDTSPAALHLVPIISSTSASNVASTRHHASYHARGSSGSDGNVSPLDSPALSYSNSTRTPATLSPATPFSAFAEGPPFDGGVVVTTGNAREDGIKGEVGLGVSLNESGKEKNAGAGAVNSATMPSNVQGGQGRVAVAGRTATTKAS